MNIYLSNGFKREKRLICKLINISCSIVLVSVNVTAIIAIASLRDDYLLAVEGMKGRLLQRTKVSNLTFLGELDNNGNSFRPKMVR